MQGYELRAGGHRIAAFTWGQVGQEKPVVVMMHGGLDCTSTWRDLPDDIARATGLGVLSYDRWGYGGSEAFVGRRDRSYRFEESGPVLGEVLNHFAVRQAVIFGHSDGGAMGILAAEAHPDTVIGVCACSPTAAVDLPMVRAMSSARDAFEHGGLRDRLRKHHGDKTDAMFWAWYEPWADEAAAHWSMAGHVASVRCPVSAIFGQDDAYGWRASARLLVDHGSMPLELAVVDGGGHDPHHKVRRAALATLDRLLNKAGVPAASWSETQA